jgi:hypothetical protein
MRVEFLAPAASEFSEAIAFYESRKQGLGSEFAVEVRRTIERILQYPVEPAGFPTGLFIRRGAMFC